MATVIVDATVVLAAEDAEVVGELALTLVVRAADRGIPKFASSDSASLFHLDLVDGCELLFRYDSSPKYLVRGRIKNLRRCPSCIAVL